MKRKCLVFLFLCFSCVCFAQIETPDSIFTPYADELTDIHVLLPQRVMQKDSGYVKALDALPAFGVFRDNYFITGIPLNKSINKNTADAMFQLSIRQRLTNTFLPFNTFLYLTYTQKNFWNIYSSSCPFRDTNYNPGIGIGKPITMNNQIVGAFFLQLMHESNGRDSTESRSWNYLSVSGKYFFNARINIMAEAWIPYVDGDNNKDLLDYRGYGQIAANFITPHKFWWFTAKVNPRNAFGMNVELTASCRLSSRMNQYAFVKFYSGYAEGLLDYKKHVTNVRIGICIKPDFYSFF